MKQFILPFLFVLFFTLSSCGTARWTVSTYMPDPYPVQWVDVYDFNRIHWLYLNHPNFVWGNYWNHPFFIRYRTDCLRRGIYVPRYRPNRSWNRNYINRTWNNRNSNRVVRQNSGRSNKTYRRTTPVRRNYSPTRVNNTRVKRSTPTRRNYSSQRRTPTRNYSRSRSTRTRSSSVQSRSSTRRSSPVRSSSRRSGGRQNN